MEYSEFKSKFEELFTILQDSYTDGEISAFDFYKSMKYAIAVIEPNLAGAEYEAKTRLQSIYTKEELSQMGVEIKEGRTMYSFKNVKFTPYVEAKEKEKEATANVKAVEKMLIANIGLNQKAGFCSTEGELLEMPEVSYSKPSVIIKQF